MSASCKWIEATTAFASIIMAAVSAFTLYVNVVERNEVVAIQKETARQTEQLSNMVAKVSLQRDVLAAAGGDRFAYKRARDLMFADKSCGDVPSLLKSMNFAVPGVGAELKLRRVPRMVIRDFTSCCIDDWGVEVSPATKATAEEMASSSVRKFLGLYYKSQQGTLTVEDRKVWRQMLADFDSDMYVEVSAPAVQTLGVLKSLKPKYAIVQWSDDPGEDDRVDGVFRTRLSCLHEGDMFSATVKFVAGKLVSMDNVFPCNV